jgi:aspartyl-tRNA synthetase
MERILSDQTPGKTGEQVTLSGWVHSVRTMGDKLIFVDLRDRTGLVQLVCYKPDMSPEAASQADELKPEFVVQIEGKVQDRGKKQINPDLGTGTIEVAVTSITILNKSKTPAFEIDKDTLPVDEKVRLKYRYLDLRTERLQRNIRLRSQWVQACREFLFSSDFVEIETPLLTKATPEGSRDFVVPSRLQSGKFFALPQSPQQYKQLLMTAGFERYFQVARCMRDEDLRADRGFEHSQVDIEMSFMDQEAIMNMVEQMTIFAAEKLGFTIKEKPFPRISFKDSMEQHGADKFDLRTEKDIEDGVLAYAWVVDFPFFEKDERTGKWTFTHNPFSNPLPEFREDHLAGKNTENILTSQYDLVCNGYESGGGSVRAHEPEVLRATYKTMGYSEEEINESVGHMLEAFEYGAPPHGGIGMGIERNIMNLAGETALREVVAFPMTSTGNTSVMDAPASLDKETLEELKIQIKKN